MFKKMAFAAFLVTVALTSTAGPALGATFSYSRATPIRWEHRVDYLNTAKATGFGGEMRLEAKTGNHSIVLYQGMAEITAYLKANTPLTFTTVNRTNRIVVSGSFRYSMSLVLSGPGAGVGRTSAQIGLWDLTSRNMVASSRPVEIKKPIAGITIPVIGSGIGDASLSILDAKLLSSLTLDVAAGKLFKTHKYELRVYANVLGDAAAVAGSSTNVVLVVRGLKAVTSIR